jgi:dienelactone hydrolase
MLLIGGSGPTDKDSTILSDRGEVLSTIFQDMATWFPRHGIATLRYNKHYVLSTTEVDQPRFATLSLPRLVHDAATVLAHAQRHPLIDARHLFVYGWSEGTVVGAALVGRQPEIAGLIMQGPLALSWRETLRWQITQVSLPYALAFSSTGRLTGAELQQALAGPGGAVAKVWIRLALADPISLHTPCLRVNALFDTDGDGSLDPETDIWPRLEQYLDQILAPGGMLALYGPGRALPPVPELVKGLRLPILVLQGACDANTPAAGLPALVAALDGHADATIQIYPGLGHALGPADSIVNDDLRPIAAPPLADTAAWVLARSRRPSAPAGAG